MAKIFDSDLDYRVSGIATPQADNEAANKKYVDDQVESAKIPVEVATNSLFGDSLSQNFTKVAVLSVNEDDEFSVAPESDGGYTVSFNGGITYDFGRLGDLISIYDGTNKGTYYIYHLTHDAGADRFLISDVINGTDVIADVDNDTDGFQFYIDESFIANREISDDSITLSKTDLPNGSDGQVLTSTGSDWGWEDLPDQFRPFENFEGKGFNEVAVADQSYELIAITESIGTDVNKFKIATANADVTDVTFSTSFTPVDLGAIGPAVRISDGTTTSEYMVISYKDSRLRLTKAVSDTDVLQDSPSPGTGWSFDFTSVHGPSLRTLQGVLAPSPSTNDVLQYNGTNWVNAALPEETNGIDEYDATIAYSEGEVIWWDDRDSIYVWDSTTDSVAGTDPSESTNWKLIGAGGLANRTHPGLLKTLPELDSTHLVYYDKDDGTWAAAGTTILNNGVSPAVSYSAADNDFYRFGMDHNRFDLDKTQNNGFDIIWDIKDGGIGTDQLAGDAVTTAKIADDAVEFKQIMATRADTPADDAGKVLKVNSTGTGLEWAEDSASSDAEIDARVERYIDAEMTATYTDPDASGTHSVAIGNGATSTHTESMAIGFEAASSKNYDLRLGGIRQHPTIHPDLAGNEGASNELASVAFVNSKVAASHQVVNATSPNAIGDSTPTTFSPTWEHQTFGEAFTRNTSDSAGYYKYTVLNSAAGITLNNPAGSTFLTLNGSGNDVEMVFDGEDARDNSAISLTGGGVWQVTATRSSINAPAYDASLAIEVVVGTHVIGKSNVGSVVLTGTNVTETLTLTVTPSDDQSDYTLNEGDVIRVRLSEHLHDDYVAVSGESVNLLFNGGYDTDADHELTFSIKAHAHGAALQITDEQDLVYTDDSGDTITLIDNSVSSTTINPGALASGAVAGDVLGYTTNGLEWVAQDAEDYVHVNSDGDAPSADGQDAIAIGEGANASSVGSVAIGLNADVESTHNNSIALGADAQSTAANQLLIGSTTAADSISAIVTPGFTGGADQFITVDASGNWSIAQVEGGNPYLVVNSDGTEPDIVGDDSIGLGENSTVGQIFNLSFTTGTVTEVANLTTIATSNFQINGVDASADNSITIPDGEAFTIVQGANTFNVVAEGALPINSTTPSLALGAITGIAQNTDSTGRFDVAAANSIAIGVAANTGAASAVALGELSIADGTESVALGHSAAAIGEGSVALGRDSAANADNSVAIGNAVTNNTADSVLIGAASQTVLLGRTTSDTDSALAVASKGYVDANLSGGAKIENFDHGGTYAIGDFAVSDDRLWVATAATEPENDWDPEVSYAVGDLVFYQGLTYIADQALAGNPSNQPPPTDVAIWSVHLGNEPQNNSDDWEEVSPQRALPSLNEITDVDTEGVSDGQILRFDSTDSEWQVKDLTLNEIDNVTVTDDANIAEHTILQANSSNHFVERTPAQFLATGNIGELGDVSAATPVENDVLQWNATNSAWEAGAITADVSTAVLSDLSDVAEDAATNGQVLTWNVTDGNGVWVPADVPGIGGEFNFYDANAGSNTNSNGGAANATAQDSLALGQYASIVSQSDNATDNVIMLGGAPGAGTDGSFAGAIIGMAGQNRVFETSGNGITRFDAIDDPNGGIWYGALNTNDLNERAKWNFDRFGALQPFNRVPSNSETFPDQYTYYTSSQSSLVGYSEGALARVIKPLSTGTTGDSAPDGFLVKMFYYDSSDNLESCTLVWISVESDDHSDFIGLFTDGLTDVWANSDSQSGGVLNGRGSIALDPLSGDTVNQAGALTIGAWTGFDKSHTIDFAQMLGSVVYLYDSNGNLTTTRYRGRLVSDV